eukprot:TRINITY_DN33204_c0_g1_i1.p1 TRINITY_DN33204_c0_g1~~TRINITY_DN33204_c0_g1_i1.p1  ORF type:complete len:482 (+),score=175.54 TRINITY_DN33204_c0_g1_i1:87-1448(+)
MGLEYDPGTPPRRATSPMLSPRSPDCTAHLRGLLSPPVSRCREPAVDTPPHFKPGWGDSVAGERTVRALSSDERAAIHQEAAVGGSRIGDVAGREVDVLRLQNERLRSEVQELEEEKVVLELGLCRGDRMAPALTSALQALEEKERLLRIAVSDPEASLGHSLAAVRAAIPAAAGGLAAEIEAAQAEARLLAEQTAELEQECLIKSIDTCHALEMLSASMRYHSKWSDDAVEAAARLESQLREAERAAIAAAEEEAAALTDLTEVRSSLADRKRGMQVVHRRLLAADPLPTGRYIDDQTATALLMAVKGDVARGSLQTLRAIECGGEYSVAAALQVSVPPLLGRASTPPPAPAPSHADAQSLSSRCSMPPSAPPSVLQQLAMADGSPPPAAPPPPPAPFPHPAQLSVAGSASAVSMASQRSVSEVTRLHQRAQMQLRSVTETLSALSVGQPSG